jgi:hypothetical protein
MGCLSRFLIVGALLTQLIASAAALLVLGSAGVLGEAAIMSAEDVMILFVLMALNLLATVVLAIKVWSSGRAKKRMGQELSTYRVGQQPGRQDANHL